MTATLTHPNSIDLGADRIADHERRCLCRALRHLVAGDAPGFHYALWVGYGGGWRTVRQTLVRDGLVDPRKHDHDAGPTGRTAEYLRAFEERAA